MTWGELRAWGDAHLHADTPLWVGCLGNASHPPTAQPLWELKVVTSVGRSTGLLQGGPGGPAALRLERTT